MSITYAGVTPSVLVDTHKLQDTEKLSKREGKLVRNHNGVCMSTVVDWLLKCQQNPDGVTDISQLKGGLGLSLMQTSYMRGAFGAKSGPDAFISDRGLTISASKTRKKTGGTLGTVQFQAVAMECLSLIGCAQISIFGDGGHALGFRQTSSKIQFYDPNEGILEFSSGNSFGKWFPPYIIGEYPDLLAEIVLRKVS